MNCNTNFGSGCPQQEPTYTCCNDVVNKCFVQEIPHYTNYHTHVVNNCVRRHVNIPTFSTDEETVIIDEYAQGPAMMYGQPMMGQPYPQPLMGQQSMYGQSFMGQQQMYNQPMMGQQAFFANEQQFNEPAGFETAKNILEGQQSNFNPNFNPYSF